MKKEARKVGFAAVGISNPDRLRDLPYGKIDYVGVLKTPVQELPRVRSARALWD
jgi:hypothetical protein